MTTARGPQRTVAQSFERGDVLGLRRPHEPEVLGTLQGLVPLQHQLSVFLPADLVDGIAEVAGDMELVERDLLRGSGSAVWTTLMNGFHMSIATTLILLSCAGDSWSK